MALGVYGQFKETREMGVQMEHLATDVSTGTATDSSGDGVITMNAYAGKVTTIADSAASDGTYTLTITNDKVAAGDMAFVSFTLASGTAANVSLKDVLCGAGTLTIILQNPHDATAWSDAVFVVSFMVVKAL